MPSDKETQKRCEELMVSIRYQRSRRGKGTANYFQNSRVSREIEELIRKKVVRELHDGLTQTMSALAMRINFARRLMISDPDAAERELEKVEDLTRETTREIRHMIFILRQMEMESLDRIDGQVVQLEIEEASKSTTRAESPFQGQELESIQKFAGLINGSVSVENEGMLVRILFPFTQTAEEVTSPPQ
jgi:signal transduction histidine kinase